VTRGRGPEQRERDGGRGKTYTSTTSTPPRWAPSWYLPAPCPAARRQADQPPRGRAVLDAPTAARKWSTGEGQDGGGRPRRAGRGERHDRRPPRRGRRPHRSAHRRRRAPRRHPDRARTRAAGWSPEVVRYAGEQAVGQCGPPAISRARPWSIGTSFGVGEAPPRVG
jgi:hypothetical protein